MSNENKILKIEDVKSVAHFLQSSTLKIAEVLTGILASDSADWKLSSGKLIQSVIKGNFFTQLGREIRTYQEKGEIKEDYLETSRNRATFYELLKYLEDNVPDDDLFCAMKSIFLSGVQSEATEEDELFAYEFLLMAKTLNGIEIVILGANYKIAQKKQNKSVSEFTNQVTQPYSRAYWRRAICLQLNQESFDGVIRKYEIHLEELGLISPRTEDSRFARDFEPTQYFRLTDTGFKFCEFILRFPGVVLKVD